MNDIINVSDLNYQIIYNYLNINLGDNVIILNIDENFIQISGGKLTGFRIIAKESLEQLFSQKFELNKQEFVDSILNLENQFNYKDLQLCLNHYCVVKPTDYLLRRTRISWFNQNGGKSLLDKVMVNFDSTLYFEQTIEELQDEGLL